MSSNTFWNEGPNPDWVPGQGATDDEWKNHKKIAIDPFESGRTRLHNYRLLSSAITPRPIGFISTITPEGVPNLAPFSYFNVICADPPLFSVSFSGDRNKDSLNGILHSGELTINVISEWFVDAANATAVAAPPDADEWVLSGLTPSPSEKVKPAHVAESGFSVEAKLVDSKTYYSRDKPGVVSGVVVTVEAVNFHVREDLLEDEEKMFVDTGKLKPIGRLGKNSYTSVNNGYNLKVYNYEKDFPDV
ncbi:hypothetical protein PSN45_005249 [Yamadazyma tenuis]|uniref:Flavo protein oxygenase n=1 Tax=Candida tenuis (strain ATCC 10573 / BCRC 21748 / CBS 615 / JCM 9827 / NBRC 10315 / NRRL Y-1498 / VKM Y-70) TaxID=590646 RepID=G3B173_CANTC|nr:flavo protein oxygenase [Yamadazyma tenuis ATCC 10573]XP_006685976.1 uncharacterized protein CANTEDRAFT_113655 [Yamadazyma tenuis ATCC 10573]EGV65169.1 flavo protein oxygenase [Yamadazyma tenuis ATCC 10573]EGV65170.1 hypothetical protein CANTEDRAFT_113655 [Yamadazyma tenuis ATCC 10573]WEJ97691.1 hypothetical protein PSN45_005249 [Yamadazyma tenuis]